MSAPYSTPHFTVGVDGSVTQNVPLDARERATWSGPVLVGVPLDDGNGAVLGYGPHALVLHVVPGATAEDVRTREDYTVALTEDGPVQSLSWPTAEQAQAWLDSAQNGADGPKFPDAVVLHRIVTLREVK